MMLGDKSTWLPIGMQQIHSRAIAPGSHLSHGTHAAFGRGIRAWKSGPRALESDQTTTIKVQHSTPGRATSFLMTTLCVGRAGVACGLSTGSRVLCPLCTPVSRAVSSTVRLLL